MRHTRADEQSSGKLKRRDEYWGSGQSRQFYHACEKRVPHLVVAIDVHYGEVQILLGQIRQWVHSDCHVTPIQ